MITAADSEFHERDTTNPAWAETRFISFSIPEEQLFCNFHVLAPRDARHGASATATCR